MSPAQPPDVYPRIPRPTPVEWLLLVLGLALTNHYAWILDDAYIYFRYIDNFVDHGLGWVYNEGEFVEGFTSPLWLMILTILHSIRVDYWHAARGIGLLSFGAFWWGLVVLGRELSPNRGEGPQRRQLVNGPLVFLGLNYATLCYFTSGVEAPLVQVAAVAYALFFVKPNRAVAGAVVLISPLIRPELALGLAFALLYRWWRERRFPLQFAILAAATNGAWLLFRVYFYADFLPNTFYLKHVPLLAQGLVFLQQSLTTYAVYPVAAAAAVGTVALCRRRVPQGGIPRIAMLVLAIAIAAYFVRIGGDPRHHRYLAFSFCLAACSLAGLAEHILATFAPRVGARWVASLSLLAALLFAALYPPQLSGHPIDHDVSHEMVGRINDAHFHRTHPSLSPPAWSLLPLSHKQSALFMAHRSSWHSGYTKIATSGWCETNYWLLNRRVIHGAGLTDAVLARTQIWSRKAAHKPLLELLARDLVKVYQNSAPGIGMYRKAVADRVAAPWIGRNLESLELIERKIYNEHDLLENLRLAFTRVRPIEIMKDGEIRPQEREGAALPGSVARPNVVLILIDTIRPDHMSAYGYRIETTPALSRLAGDSILFERAYSTAPWTLPAAGSIMTGQHPRVIGSEGELIRLHDEFVTLAELFKEKGYRTGAIVSHSLVSAEYGFQQGFDLFDSDEAVPAYRYVSSPGVTEKAIQFARENRDQPFFLFLHYFDPHYSYVMHPILNTFPDYRGSKPSGIAIERLRRLSRADDLTSADLRFVNALYDSEVRFTDFHIGRVLMELKRQGLYRDAAIIVTGDHGEELAERSDGWIGHTKRVTESLIRVPLIIKLPGNQVRRRVARPVSIVDLMPTIAEIAGLDTPAADEISGRPIQLLAPAPQRDIFAETGRFHRVRGLVSGRWKLVTTIDKRMQRGAHLYDLQSDPEEVVDVLDANPGVARQMQEKMKRWLARTDELTEKLDLSLEKPLLSDEQKRALEALGYTEPREPPL